MRVQDAHRAFDKAFTHLEEQIRRYKRKLKNHHDKARARKRDAGLTANRRSTMKISDLLKPPAVIVSLKAQGKKHLLQEIAARAAQVTRLPERKIFETLIERERLGSTGMGQGIAIPHGRLADISEIMGVFARLETPIDYDAVDNQPVDLVFLLLAPEGAAPII